MAGPPSPMFEPASHFVGKIGGSLIQRRNTGLNPQNLLISGHNPSSDFGGSSDQIFRGLHFPNELSNGPSAIRCAELKDRKPFQDTFYIAQVVSDLWVKRTAPIKRGVNSPCSFTDGASGQRSNPVEGLHRFNPLVEPISVGELPSEDNCREGAKSLRPSGRRAPIDVAPSPAHDGDAATIPGASA